MSIVMYKWIAFSLGATESTNYSVVRDDIIRQAYEYCGLKKVFSDAAVDALNRIVKKFHQLGVPGWKVIQTNNALVASSEVVVSSRNFTCILPHTSSSDNQPITGSEWEVFWVEAGENGTAWATATNYSSASVKAVDSDVIHLEQASIIDKGSKFQLYKRNRISFEDLNKSSPFGTPQYIWFERLRDTAFYHLFPFPSNDDVSEVILITKDVVLLGDFDVGSDGPDFPVTYIEVLVKLLAADLTHIEGLSTEEKVLKKREAKESLEIALMDMQRVPEDSPEIFGAY